MQFRLLQRTVFASCVIFFTIQCRDVMYNVSTAQIIPDTTLPTQSTVRQQDSTRIIEGGTQAGSNLFHSFSEFSVPNGSTAFFNNALDIQNILTRVTGNSISNINGLIRTNGTANLFLINPNGIIFGQNARLNIGGSFFAASADSMKFASGFEFSAKNPLATPLLTISAPIGLQFGASPGLIGVQGNGQGIRTDDSLIDTQDGLRVQPDKTLALVGGDINLEGATLKTAGGRIELGSVAANNLVSLTPINFGFALGYNGVQNFGNIQLSQRASVDASGEGAGDIQVQGRRVTVTNGSQIETSTLGTKQGGDLVVNATESVEASGVSSGLVAFVYPNATGNAGNLTLNTRELLVRDGAFVNAGTSGAGKGGNLAVTTERVQVIGRSSDGSNGSNLFALSDGMGDAGDLTLNTRELLIQNGGFVSTITSGKGKGGNLTVTADSIQVIGRSADGYGTYLSTETSSGSTGNVGNLTINTRELLIKDGAQVYTGTFGAGKEGNLAVTAERVQVIGRSVDGRGSNLSTQANLGSTGDAGDLTINTRELLVQDGASITTNTISTGNAGNLRINTGELLVQDGAFVSTGTFGAGKGGNLDVTASRVQVIGTSLDDQFPSSLSSQAERSTTGDGGDLTINTGELLIRDGASISASIFGAGNGGNLTVTADSIQVIGRSADGRISNISAQANRSATGNAGDLTINTRELLVEDGAQVNASTFGAGKGGNLAVTADNIQVVGSSDSQFSSNLSAQAERTATGNAGNLTINTRDLVIRDGAFVSSGTFGAGLGGDLAVTAERVQVIGGSSDGKSKSYLSTQADGIANAGNLTLNTGELLVQDGAAVSASTIGTGNAGDLTINTRELQIRDGAQVSTGTIGAGKGGDLAITASHVQVIGRSSSNPSFLTVQTEGTGDAGDLTINTRELLVQDKAFVSAGTINTGNAGNLTINTHELQIQDGASVNASTLGAGKGGNLAITADSVKVIGRSSDNRRVSNLSANADNAGRSVAGDAGDLTINTRELLVQDGAVVSTSTLGAGKGGNLVITAERVQVFGTSANVLFSSNLAVQAQGTGNAGNLTINTRQLFVLNEAAISAGTIGAGKGGNLTINTGELLIRDGAGVNAATINAGKGGNLAVTADSVQVIGRSADGRRSGLSAQSQGTGDAGNLTLNTRELLIRNGAFVDTSTFDAGKGGNLAVNSDSVQLIGDQSALSALTEGKGDAGNLTLNTRELQIRDGAQVTTSTFSAGKGGNLTVIAELVQLIGEGIKPVPIAGEATVSVSSGLFSSSQQNATGEGGNLIIQTRQLLIQDGATMSVSSIGKGKAGNLTLDANSIRLNNAATINADTTGGGGNIFLNSPLLVLRRGSSITTNASGDNITGGNITIDAKNGFIVAVPQENSDIRADSQKFRGGNIAINNTAGIFGIQPRKEPSPLTSDITVKGATPQLSGTLQINNLDINRNQGLVPLTVDVVDVARLVDDNICVRTANSSFTYIGRGGLPASPNLALNSNAVWEDWRLTAAPREREQKRDRGQTENNNSSRPTQIVEAQGWIINQNGEVTLTADTPTATLNQVGSSSLECQPATK